MMFLFMKNNLKPAILVPFIVTFLITFFSISAFQIYKSEQRMVTLSSGKLSLISNGIHSKLDEFLKEPLQLGMSISNVISSASDIEEDALLNMKKHMFSAFSGVYHHLPQVQLVGFGYENGDFVGFRKGEGEHDHLLLKDNTTNGQLIFYSDKTVNGEPLLSVPNYDPTERSWYHAAIEANGPVWSSLYNSYDIYTVPNNTISAVIPSTNSLDLINGVLTVDISIDQLTEFMIDLKNQYNVTVYIFDDRGDVISHSGFNNINHSDELSITKISATSEPVVTHSLNYLFGEDSKALESPTTFQTNIDGVEYYNNVTPYIDMDLGNLRWYVGVSVSKESLVAESIENHIISFIIGAIICFIAIYFVSHHINKIINPIKSMILAADRMAKGVSVEDINDTGHVNEVKTLVNSFNHMANKVDDTISKLKYQAFNDRLTGLLNKPGLDEYHKNIKSENGTFFLFSINDFRTINNSLGYVKGNDLLKQFAEKLSQFSVENSLIARVDGGKFALFLPVDMDVDQSTAYAMNIKQALVERVSVENTDVAFRVTVGIVLNCASYYDIDQCLRNASIALSNCKKECQGRITHFNNEMLELIEHKTQMCADINKGLENQEFLPFYQPIVDLKTGNVVGAEALARWLSPTLGMVPPDKFIPIAEESGFIDKLGELILFKACSDLHKGIREGKWSSDFKMHVNLSVLQLLSTSFISSLQEIITTTAVSPKNLSLEITESGLAQNKGIFRDNLEAIMAMGIEISIDDFGTGYSSLSYLQNLEFDCLKIDRAFVSTLTQDNLDTSLAGMIMKISKNMDAHVVAEGIETESQASLLLKLNCEFGQGYYFGRPTPYSDWNY